MLKAFYLGLKNSRLGLGLTSGTIWSVTDQIMKVFIAVEIAMGLVHKPTLESYFQDTG